MDFNENAAPPAAHLVINGRVSLEGFTLSNQRAQEAALARRRAAQRALELPPPPAPTVKRKIARIGPIRIFHFD